MSRIAVNNVSISNDYQVRDVYSLDGEPINNLISLYDFMETILKEIIEVVFKRSLSGNHYQYMIMGGKAINNIVSDDYLGKSFDFDLHLIQGNEYKLNEMGDWIVNNMNNFMNNTENIVYRHYIINILRKHNLISENQIQHYSNNQLFYYGKRIKHGFSIKGIFIHFLLRDDIFGMNQKYTNARPPHLHTDFHDDTITNYNSGNNELFYPISDIDLEQYLNFGIPIQNPVFIYESYDQLKYCSYLVLVFNLIKYVLHGGTKRQKNLIKLNNVIDIKKYKCYFTSNNSYNDLKNNLDQLVGMYGNELNQIIGIDPTDLRLTTNVSGEIFTNRTYYDVLDKLLILYRNQINTVLNNCRDKLILNMDGPNTNNIFNDNVNGNQQLTILASIERLIFNHDVDRYVFCYTTNAYSSINLYCQYLNLGINSQNINYPGPVNINRAISFSDNTISNINQNVNVIYGNMNNIINGISTTIQICRNDQNYINSLVSIKDEFFTIRAQNFISFNSPNGDIFNPSILKTGGIIYIPFFASSFFKTNSYSYPNFIYSNTFLFKIRINKNSRKWIMLNKYSQYDTESEVLFDKDIFFTIENYKYKSIKWNDQKYRDILVINVKLCDTLQEAIHHRLNVSNNEDINIFNINEDKFTKLLDNTNSNENRGKLKNLKLKSRLILQNNFFMDFENRLLDNNNDNLTYDTDLYKNLYNTIMNDNEKLLNKQKSIIKFDSNNEIQRYAISGGLLYKNIEKKYKLTKY
ncbi:hypothetical protein Indivirus_2_53 [Indivirus ILV1]|uniref:Uncharacterized protein n=1 Tax=Indivirus ILV1 TaxID=1977633 RepID=A0A1V0SDH0_9VIRU|nr:hypothetical protein Indivirus_2_53 [Indivirus ILV1]